MSNPSDEAVMAKIQAGRLELLGVLFARHSRRAYALCYRMVGDGSTAEDLVQEAFLRVLRYRDKFRGDARFATWLHRIVRNVCLDHLGARDRERIAVEELSADPSHRDAFASMDESDISVTRMAFERLSEDQRQCLVLARIDGWGYKEIAARLGTSEGAARVRVHRAMNELKSIMGELAEQGS
jgi:RNA polymerase sigma factor (sigma-70 family)